MSVRFDARNKRWRFEFDRYIAGGPRQRTSRLLPRGWSRHQAQDYDRAQTGRLYALAAGIDRPARLIDDAVLVYLRERGPQLKNFRNLQIQLAVCSSAYAGRAITELPAVAREYAAAHATTLAPATVRNRMAYLRAACRYAWRHHHYCEHDPAARLVLPPANNARTSYLSRADMLRIARCTPHRQARAAIRVAFYSGMRQAEICRAQASAGLFVLADTKNGTPRSVPIHPKLTGIVRTPALWPITCTTWTLSKQYKAAARRVGLGHTVFHTLRHSTASAMINAGVDLYTVGGVLGHKSPQSTQRYAHLATANLARALGTIGQKSPHTFKKDSKKSL